MSWFKDYYDHFEAALASVGVSLQGLQGEVPAPPDSPGWERRGMGILSKRQDFVARYSFAVPSKEAIAAIARYSPLIEIGAGTGCWAKLLQDAGADILAFDKAPPGVAKNEYFKGQYTEVRQGGPEAIREYPDRTLFLCWPPHATSMAHECLQIYRGEHFIYIGEGESGCTGDDQFHQDVKTSWQAHESMSIPQWPGNHDRLTIYRRKERG